MTPEDAEKARERFAAAQARTAHAFRLLTEAVRAGQIALERFGQVLAHVGRRSAASVELAPVRHAFAPTLDLACAVCGLGPEECTGDTPRGTDPRYAGV